MEANEEYVVVNSSRLKSVVWNDFDRVKKGESFVAICRLCKRMLNGSSTSGTSHLRNHLIRCRKRSNHDVSQLITRGKRKQSALAVANFTYNDDLLKNQTEMVTVASMPSNQGIHVGNGSHGMSVGNGNQGSIYFDHRRSHLDLARMIIVHGYPLDMVEDAGFKTFVRNIQPLFDLQRVSGVTADCMDIYKTEKQRVYEELDKFPGKISLSAERWIVKEDTEFLCLTAHYIDDAWELKKKLLNFLVIDSSQAEESFSEVIMTCLRDWDIDRKLFSLTIDNLPSYDKVVSGIRDQLCQHRFLMCDGQLFDVRCAASTVKSLVLDVLEISHELINKVRETIRYVNSSQAIQEKFDEIVQSVGINSQKCLSLDCPTQWNSTYMMLDSVLEYKEAFTQLQEDESDNSLCPPDIDWDRVRAITSILKFFYEVCSVFVGNKHITANTYFSEICDIHLQLHEWCQRLDDFISSLALKLRSKFDEYWKKCSLIMAVAAILDPRFKMKLVEYYYPQIYGDGAPKCIDIVSTCMNSLYNGHAIYSPLAGLSSVSEINGIAVKGKLHGFDRFVSENSLGQSTNSDLDKYLEEPLFPRSADFSILNWWKVHEPRYPVLSMMARSILGIPISKIAPECLFGTGYRSLNQNWRSVNFETLQALMCSQDWIRPELESKCLLY